MKSFFLIIGTIVLILDAWSMKKEYDKQNLAGVIHFGFWTLILFMALY